MTELDTDILDRGGRLKRIALATLIGGAFTFVVLSAMINSGRGPQQDPVGQASVVIMGVIMFVLVSSVAHRLILRVREAKKKAAANRR
jgi:hypothetical protein